MLNSLIGKVSLGLLGGQGALLPPVAALSADQTTVAVGEIVTFLYTGTGGTPTTVLWDFSDLGGGTGFVIQHSWSVPGEYEVYTTASNAAGSSFASVTITVTGYANTAPPTLDRTNATIAADTIHGTAGTWTGYPSAPTLTYQWQRFNGTTWDDISGATSIDRAPQDADFGRYVALLEIPNATAADGVRSAPVWVGSEQPAHTLGSELWVNNLFENWTGDNPDGCTLSVAESPPNYYVTETAEDGSAGTDAMRFVSDSAAFAVRQTILTQNKWYETVWRLSQRTGGTIGFGQSGSTWGLLSAVDTNDSVWKATGVSGIAQFARSSGTADAVIPEVSVKEVTRNGVLTMPSSDGHLVYEIPSGTFHKDSRVMLQFRIADDAAGNYLSVEVYLPTSGGSLFMAMYRVTGNSKTALQTITSGVGTPTHIKASFIGDQVSMYTSTDGVAFTQKGSTATETTYQTATGCNVISPSSLPYGTLTWQETYSADDFGEVSQEIDENNPVVFETDRTYEFTEYQEKLISNRPSLHLMNDGLVPASPPVFHKSGYSDADAGYLPGRHTFQIQDSPNIEIEGVNFSGEHLLASGWTNGQASAINFKGNNNANANLHDLYFEGIVGFVIQFLTHSAGFRLANIEWYNTGNGVNGFSDDSYWYNLEFSYAEGIEGGGDNAVFGKDESNVDAPIYGQHVYGGISFGGDQGTNVAIGMRAYNCTIEDEARSVVAFIIADNVDDFILTGAVARNCNFGYSAQSPSALRPITDAHFVNCLADLCGQGYYFPNSTGVVDVELDTCIATDSTYFGLNCGEPGMNCHDSSFTGSGNKDVYFNVSATGCTFPLIGEANENTYVTITDNRT